MVKFTLVEALAVLLVDVGTSEALKCYVCGYSDNEKLEITGDNVDSSCKGGKKPKADFILDCDSLEYTPIGKNRYVGLPKNSGLVVNSTDLVALKQLNAFTLTCTKITADGRIKSIDEIAKAAIRTCIMVTGTNKTLPDKCYEEENSKLQGATKEKWFKSATAPFQEYFTNSTSVGACSCSGNECNGALKSVTVSVAVLLVSTVLAYFGKIF